MTVKLRTVATSRVLTVPAYLKTTAREYHVFTTKEGVIMYIPATRKEKDTVKFLKEHGFELPLYNF